MFDKTIRATGYHLKENSLQKSLDNNTKHPSLTYLTEPTPED